MIVDVVHIDPIASPMPADPVARWLDLELRRKQLAETLAAVASEQERLRVAILERWSCDGTTHVRLGGYAIHTRRCLYPKGADRRALTDAIRAEGLEGLLTVDEKALGAYIAEREDAGETPPASILALVGEPFERFALAVRSPNRTKKDE